MSRAASENAVLALEGITKRFGTTLALDNTSLIVRGGTVHAVLGENGAGKTTLMRIAFGLVPPDAGTVTIAGATRRVRSAADAIAAGVGMVHQHFTNVPAMTVAENVSLGDHGRFDVNAARQRVIDIGAHTGLALDPNAVVAALSVGAQQRLEIVKALVRNARTLILDEPTAVLAPKESEELLRWLRAFADRGNAVVLITHKLREALSISDDVTVLRRGRNVLSSPATAVTDASLAAAMLGEDFEQRRHAGTATATGQVVARAERLTLRGDRGVTTVREATFEVRSGETVGIVGVEGAGQHELLRALADRLKPAAGRVLLPTVIGFVPEDRHRDALALDFSVVENLALKGAGARHGLMPWRALRVRADALVREYDVRGADDPDRVVRDLSGGNQQKLVLARELDDRPALLVVENPTRGLDIRATAAVHDRLRAAAADGTAVVVHSSDLDEVLSLASRLLVMHAGTLRETSFDRGAIGRAMLGLE
ncbi:MAG: ABC transporter ATP-binding protein [Gemmatimonadaceae bacterium]